MTTTQCTCTHIEMYDMCIVCVCVCGLSTKDTLIHLASFPVFGLGMGLQYVSIYTQQLCLNNISHIYSIYLGFSFESLVSISE